MKYKEIKERLEVLEHARSEASKEGKYNEALGVQSEINRLNNLETEK
jgi:hypothetical protein